MAIYDAFISYSHAKDKPIAAAIQSAIQKLGKPWYRRRALRLFRDDTSLSATPHLWPTIEQALAQSRFFLLLASPEAAASKWVNKEVAYWLENNSIDTLLIGLTDGELAWDDSAGDFFAGKIKENKENKNMPLPPVLAKRFASEPKWVDLRPYREGAERAANKRDAKFTELAADFAAALKSYRNSLANRLAQSDPGNAGWQHDLAVSYVKLADVYRCSNDRGNALAALRQGEAIMDRLAKLSPDNAGWKDDLGWFDRQIAALTK